MTAEVLWVGDDDGLAALVATLASEPVYALDTEFHRERTYFPKVGLVQLAWPGGVALVDPLAADLSAFRPVLEGEGLAVLHAGSQDLEILRRACDTVPSRLFDTQLAAGFLGFSSPALATLVERVLGVRLPKASRLTDWLARPLEGEVLEYAAADVSHLLELQEALRHELDAAGRLAWAEEECELLRARSWLPPDPDAAWLRLKDSRSLRGRARGVAQAVAAWRERRAAALDIPARFVLSDLALVGMANSPPSGVEQLRRVRGFEERHARGEVGGQLLAAVARGRELPDGALHLPRREEVEREQRPAVALVLAWLSQLSRDLRIDASLLATRADLASFLAADPDARLAHGWRAALLGDPIRRLVAGEFALAFEPGGNGTLVLERRSGQPVTVDLPLPRARWARAG